MWLDSAGEIRTVHTNGIVVGVAAHRQDGFIVSIRRVYAAFAPKTFSLYQGAQKEEKKRLDEYLVDKDAEILLKFCPNKCDIYIYMQYI